MQILVLRAAMLLETSAAIAAGQPRFEGPRRLSHQSKRWQFRVLIG